MAMNMRGDQSPASKSGGKLKKLRMPGSDSGESDMMAGMEDSGDEGGPEEEAAESPAEAQAEGDTAQSPELEHVSDDELMAEMKKRGLMAELSHGDSGHGDESAPY